MHGYFCWPYIYSGYKNFEIKNVQKIIGSLKPGQIIDMQIQRDGRLINVNILVSKMNYY